MKKEPTRRLKTAREDLESKAKAGFLRRHEAAQLERLKRELRRRSW